MFQKYPFLNQMIVTHKEIYNNFGSGIYHKPNSTFKYKSKEFQKSKIGLLSDNYTITAKYVTGIYRDLSIQKILQYIIIYAEFRSMIMNKKNTKL